jgi:hypothetical protein
LSEPDRQPSAIESALLNRQRKVHVFDALALKSDGSNPGPVAFRVPTKAEEWDARIAAMRWLKDETGPEMLDQDLSVDLATVWLLHSATRDSKDPMWPAFGRGPRWMAEQMSADEIRALLGCLYEARERESPFGRAVAGDEVLRYAEGLADATLDEAGELLATVSRENLIQLCVGLAKMAAEGMEDGS